MDVAVILCLFVSIFMLPAGLLMLVNPKIRKLGTAVAILSAIGLAITGTMVWHLYR
ncbi:MAG TPA: hypothetical protein VL574_14290 [Stellaceae bacterium]|jgi:hypothetical protein|nr:hypothetical protein [Stellaceae bacterium]